MSAASRASVESLVALRCKDTHRDRKTEDQLQKSFLALIRKHQKTSKLLQEITIHHKVTDKHSDEYEQHECCRDVQASVLEHELWRQAEQMELPTGLLTVRVLTDRLRDLTVQNHSGDPALLSAQQRSEVCALLKFAHVLLSDGLFCPSLFWQAYWKQESETIQEQRPLLEVFYHLHTHKIIRLEFLLEGDSSVTRWVVEQLKDLCESLNTHQHHHEIPCRILYTVVPVLVEKSFEESSSNLSKTCRLILDNMTSWVLDSLKDKDPGTPAANWLQVYDVSLLDACVSEKALQRFFMHTLTRLLTHRPVYTVSDAVSRQSEWSFANTPPLLTNLITKISGVFTAEASLRQLQQVLETCEVNWCHVLSGLSTLLMRDADTRLGLSDLLSTLLSSAFHTYDPEKMITAFLLARQAALEGPAVFHTYTDWFKLSFGGSKSHHSRSKKSTAFLLKFLSDLVPHEPPQYLKVHSLHPPYVERKHHSLLHDYLSLVRTRLRDLKVSPEDSGIFEVGKASASSPAQEDVKKAVTLFMATNHVPAAVAEACIFQKSYFHTRFLPALLAPRVLPVKADARMKFIEALRKADRIPNALYTSYTDSCRKMMCNKQEGGLDGDEDHHLLLRGQFLLLRKMLKDEATDADVSSQLSRISLTLGTLDVGEESGSKVIRLNLESPDMTHSATSSLILQSFCQCLLDASRMRSPNRQGWWAGGLLKTVCGHRGVLSALVHRLWDLLQNQGHALGPAHVLGLGAVLVELHRCRVTQTDSSAVVVSDCLCDALTCSTRLAMTFCLRFCVAAFSYALCRADADGEEIHHFIPEKLYKKAWFVTTRLVPEIREHVSAESADPAERVTDSIVALWTSSPVRLLGLQHQYQLSFSEWLTEELQVQRSEDALTDPERAQYQQWACEEYYLSTTSGGSVTQTCASIIHAVLDQNLPSCDPTDSCLPDLLSVLQKLLCEVALAQQTPASDFLWDVIEDRCTGSVQLQYQQTLEDISRVMVLFPAALLVRVVTDPDGRRTLDCRRMIRHINRDQRNACFPAGRLSFKLTCHFLKAVLSVSVRSDHPVSAVNACLSLFSAECPLLTLSTAHRWPRLSGVLSSQWKLLTGRDVLPQQLQILDNTHSWSRQVSREASPPLPSAPAWLLAACLWRDAGRWDPGVMVAQLETQVLLHLLLLGTSELINAHLSQQEEERHRCAKHVCVCALARLVDASDWLLLFDPSRSDDGLSRFRSLVMSDHVLRLLPFAFYSFLCALEPEVYDKAVRSPGFLYCAAAMYRDLNTLFLDSEQQDGPKEQFLLQARQMFVRSLSPSLTHSLTISQKKQLQEEFQQIDPEISATFGADSCQQPHSL